MYLDDVLAAQKRGEARGITSVCSAHPFVLKQALKFFEHPLIEATCNQVNQYGGYTGMVPKDFVAFVRDIADQVDFPFENIILGGDHLGPNVWQNEPAKTAMQKSEQMIRQYVEAGFSKIHLDCSMKLGDDPEGVMDLEVSAQRSAELAKVAETCTAEDGSGLRYIIGTEVPIPGGATMHENGVHVTMVEDVKQTIDATRQAFVRAGLESAWERVVGVVVQPGVEFGDDFVLPYQPEAARGLSKFIESQSMVYEAHSTDYQTRDSLKNLVRDHFAILKVGPGLTFAFREAVFALAFIEDELVAETKRSNIIQVLEAAMMKRPEYWKRYYRGTKDEEALRRKFSLSDRIRYYWVDKDVQKAFMKLMENLGSDILPTSLLSQFVGEKERNVSQVIEWKIHKVLDDYAMACG